MRRKGFTLVELLVVIAIIALLMGILMPALARVRQLAFRMTCGTNLAGIGKASLIYSNDYDDELPKAGGRNNDWKPKIVDWQANTRKLAFGLGNSTSATNGQVTVTSNFYLLVKYAEVTPKQFVCKGETETREFKLSEVRENLSSDFELVDAWDFGPRSGQEKPAEYCSYSYHHPFGKWALTVSSSPSMAVAADRNPWIPTPEADVKTFTAGVVGFTPDEDTISEYSQGTSESAKRGNSDAHQGDGQNVLFLDSHVAFEKRSYSGVENDNIYTSALGRAKNLNDLKGKPVVVYGTDQPKTRSDSFLVQETTDEVAGGAGGGRTR
jgi:prepilin-type N-terminal cleavage/methylation domain-containing protein